ncbi:hypothetical protein [[Mycobacterium] crassicus]|uniref:PE family protein n=1 Tax=[Mycobacterium] crassicus TaxID=2872309 RepID=A0ABU5XL05_9MYCO|nr:hypothetical protein [Mycolicibacter sp. MYC098]MEB3022876.1 hypothetical protein [Mycolicibacter sp. MYC098]
METTTSSPRALNAVIAAAALLTAGLTPVVAAPEIGTRAVATLSTEIALAGNTVVDSLADLSAFDIPSAAAALDVPGAAQALDIPGAADAFDIAGLINAEIAAAQGLVNSLFSLPVTLFNDVSSVVNSLINLDFGLAFSVAVTIPQDIINYVLGLPGLLINTAFNMAFVLPGEYLFNFG